MDQEQPQKGDKVSFKSKNGGIATARVKFVKDGFVFIAFRRTRFSFGGGYLKVPLADVKIEQRAGQVDPREHSDKGLETLAAMSTRPEDWGLTPTHVEKRRITAEVWVECPDCDGEGTRWTYKGKTTGPKAALKAIKAPENVISRAWLQPAGAKPVPCTCPSVRVTMVGRFYLWQSEDGKREHFFNTHREQGLVRAVRTYTAEVVIVDWHPDTRFDSRFHGHYSKDSATLCELCAKAIPSRRFVPVNGKSADGVIHGMWVGEDCAKKFFGIKPFKKEQVVLRDDTKEKP